MDGAGLQRDIIDWFEVHPVLTGSGLSASIVNQGRIVPPSGYSIAYPAFGLLLSPILASAAMAFSSVSVVGNSLRLRHARIGGAAT